MTQSLRIALISEHASPLATLGGVDAGGQNTYVAHVAQALARLGHQVDVLTRRDSPHLPGMVVLESGVRVFHVDAGPACFVTKEALLPHIETFARAARRLLLNRLPYDVVHANFFMSGRVAQRLRESLDVPFVITFHALGLVRLQHQREVDGFPAERIEIERELVHEADRVIAECPQDRHDLVHLYGADPHRVSVIPCGVDPAEFGPGQRAQARAALGLAQDEFVVLQLGRLVPRKGIDNVIRAVAQLSNADLPASVPVRLVIVGGDSAEPDEAKTPEIARLRAIAAECGIQDKVTFIGHRGRAELRHYYVAADVFASTPWYEPFGITPLEAMACGTPVVGSEVGGIQHSVVDGTTGFLVPPRDPQALADRLARLQANPDLGRAMGRAGIARTRSLFTWDRVGKDLAVVYEEVVASARESASPTALAVPLSLHAPHRFDRLQGARVARES